MDDEDDLFLYGNSTNAQNGEQTLTVKKDDKLSSPLKGAEKVYSEEEEDEESDSSEDDIEINLHGEAPPKAIPPLDSIRTESPSSQQHKSPLPTAGIQSPMSNAIPRDSPKPAAPFLAKDGSKILGTHSPVPSLPGRASSPPVVSGSNSNLTPDVSQPATIDGQSIYDLDIDQIPDKPWLKPGAAMSDFFNYGFNEESWKEYVKKVKSIKEEREREKSNPFTIFAKKPLEEAWSSLSQDAKNSMMQVIMSSFGGFGGPMGMPGGPMGAMAMQGLANMMPPGMQMAEAFQRGVKRQRPDDNDFGPGPMGRPGDDGPPFPMGGPNQPMPQMPMGHNMPMGMGMFGGDMSQMGPMGPNAGGGFPSMGGMGGGDMHGGGPGGPRNRPWPGPPGRGGGPGPGGGGANSMPMSGGTALGGGRGRARGGKGGNASGNSSPAVGSSAASTGGVNVVEGLEHGVSPKGNEGHNRRQASPLPTNVPTGPRKRGFKDYRDSDSPNVDQRNDQLNY